MNLQMDANTGGRRQRQLWLRRGFTTLIVLGMLFGPLLPAQVPVAVALSSSVTIVARDRATGLPLAPNEFRFLINEDIAHQASDGLPPSLTPPASYVPLVATGDESSATVSLDEGKYLVTVLAGHLPDPLGDGFVSPYKMWGAHFTVDGSGDPMTVYVDLIPNPLPLASLRVRAFRDNQMLNAQDDFQFEAGLAGFHAVIGDPVGEVTVDFFGNPICTKYDGSAGGSTPLGDPIPMTGGFCATAGPWTAFGPTDYDGDGVKDANEPGDGEVIIENLPPGKYEVEMIPPDGEGWIQTTTIEGTHAIDAWLQEGASGFDAEEGTVMPAVWFGFVRECQFGNLSDDCTGPTANSTSGVRDIVGTIRQLSLDTDAPGIGILGNPVYKPYVGLSNLSGNDELVYVGRGDENGNFVIPDVPPGLYQLVYWDYPLDYIIQFVTVQVPPGAGSDVDVGDVGTPRWFGVISGYTYIDDGVAANGTVIGGGAGNGQRDCLTSDPHDVANCERGLPGQDLDIRFKDGSIKYATFTDANGFYEYPEYFEWEHWLVWEVGFGRFAQGVTTAYETNEFGEPLGYPDDPIHATDGGPAGLLAAQLIWAGTYQWIDTGKLPWGVDTWGFSPYDPPGEPNGAISGIVYYATTRNEFDPRLAAAEDYEPGLPNVTINLYEAVLDGDGQPVACTAVGPGCPYGNGELKRGAFIEAVETDSWSENLPTDCTLPDFYLSGFTFDPDCIELPRTWNQVKDGVFDGGWAFEGLAPGQYIVEAVSPPGYQVIKEEDQNTDEGDDYVPLVPPPPCAGPLHTVDDPRNPADGEDTPLCDSRLVTVREGFNAGAEFFMMTDNAVPPPGLLRGILLDDLTLQPDPTSPLYVEKRGIPNTPIGILDYAGNEITRVYSDESGYWEVLLPSTYTALCPIPSGICPGMYQVIGNYPGTPANPDPLWNPNYGTLRLIFEIWPAKTTYADVALAPTTAFIAAPGTGFLNPVECDPVAGVPNVLSVSQPYGTPGLGSFFIYGADFGLPGPGSQVTLDGTALPGGSIISWTDTTINVAFSGLSGITPGPHQLLVTSDGGATSLTGITFHRLGTGYNPIQIHVDGATGSDLTGTGLLASPYQTIQKALDVTPDNRLILVHPGSYFETPIIDEKVKLQGYGPGATLIDGRFFFYGGGLDATEFTAKVSGLAYDGPTDVPMGQVVTVLAENGEFVTGGASRQAQIDGFALHGGNQERGSIGGGIVRIGGGAIYAHAFARNMIISNNLIQSNAGNFGGGIVLGQAFTPNPDSANALDNQNDNVRIHHNRILNNGGFRLAGGVAIFNGAANYEIDHNEICGNYSAEYGGGVSNYGRSGGSIHDNQVRFNGAFDEGGGVMIAGEQPAGAPTTLSPGTLNVTIERNLIQGNLSNDDGGGIRLLQPVDGVVRIANNMVVNNIATDFGGGISLDDALNVSIVNNTIAKNISTATAEDADRSTCSPPLLGSCPHAAGLSSEPHSAALRAARGLPLDSFSDPVLFNNIFWENESWYLTGSTTGPFLLASVPPIELEVVGTTTPKFMTPNYSILTVAYGSGTGNLVGADPLFLAEDDITFTALPFAGDPAFITVQITSTPADLTGDYHITASGSFTSPAIDVGVAASGGVVAPCDDFDGDGRPFGSAHDMGADEVAGASASSTCGALPVRLYFSTLNGSAVPGVAAPHDDADIYTWNGLSFSRVFDASAFGLLAGADVDAFWVDGSTGDIYMSFNVNTGTTVPAPVGTAQDEDIVKFSGGVWSLYFDGSAFGLTTNAEDVDAFDILPGGGLLISTVGNPTPTGAGTPLSPAPQDEDLLLCTPTVSGGAVTACTWSYYFDGSTVGLTTLDEDVDGAAVAGAHLYLSTLGDFGVNGTTGTDEDVWVCNSVTTGSPSACGGFGLYFDGSANGILYTDDLDAIDLP